MNVLPNARIWLGESMAMQVLTEVAGESLSGLANAPKNKLAQKQAAKPQEAEEEEAEDEDLAERLRAIRS